jgi:hypothetical protein
MVFLNNTFFPASCDREGKQAGGMDDVIACTFAKPSEGHQAFLRFEVFPMYCPTGIQLVPSTGTHCKLNKTCQTMTSFPKLKAKACLSSRGRMAWNLCAWREEGIHHDGLHCPGNPSVTDLL